MGRTRTNKDFEWRQPLPLASDFTMSRCPRCPGIHIELVDEHGEAFAEMIIDNETAIKIGREGANPGEVIK